MLFTWNPSPLQSSKFSFEYLLLPPRSAPAAAPTGLTSKPSTPPPRPSYSSKHSAQGVSIALTAEYRYVAPAPSIFRASWFGRWVVTHSLADSDFHGHRPAVYINQHLLWYLMSDRFRHLNSAFGSSHSASSAYQKWPTGHSHSLSDPNWAGAGFLPI